MKIPKAYVPTLLSAMRDFVLYNEQIFSEEIAKRSIEQN